MGSILDGHCRTFGFSARVTIGGGMMDFDHDSRWPVYCEACDTLRSANTTQSPLTCRTCGSDRVTKYDSTHLVEGGSGTVASWGEDKLTDGNYWCPACKTHALQFSRPHVWFD